ncbi:hypothetical protein EGW08_006857 [Elysia chlorotica]|uniref:Uncharacterized protein n=1 Tax=Elysia chlorotica TaxID=188477 RepID=A0A433TUZ1_ELYCH|nr:hypothetical protein EGW08_006857 [Elysia chlorotica]
MKTRQAVLSIALFLAVFCCVHSKESVEEGASSSSDVGESSLHMAKKRSASPGLLSQDELLLADSPYLSLDDGGADKRSSLFRFGKRQFRYGKRQFRYGKRGSLFRFGKRSGTLFRFGRSGNTAPEDVEREAVLRAILDGYLVPQDQEVDTPVAKRPSGFHWGSDN